MPSLMIVQQVKSRESSDSDTCECTLIPALMMIGTAGRKNDSDTCEYTLIPALMMIGTAGRKTIATRVSTRSSQH